jgi:hypothetical protein
MSLTATSREEEEQISEDDPKEFPDGSKKGTYMYDALGAFPWEEKRQIREFGADCSSVLLLT